MIKISFIIPVYNKELFIDRCIHSFDNLTLGKDEFEVVFIDDCSTDNSANIIKEFMEKHDYIKFHKMSSNTGTPAGPRNIGIIESLGTYVTFIDADDWIEGEGLSNLLEQMIDNNSDIGFGQSFKHTEKNSFKIARNSSYERKNNLVPYEIENIFRALGPPGKIIKKSVITENNIFFHEYKYGEDKLFFSHVISCAKRASMTDETVYHIDRYPQNNSLVNQTTIITRAPMNLEIASKIMDLDIIFEAKKYILERIVEADFINGLLIRKEFLESEEPDEVISVIRRLEDIFAEKNLKVKDFIINNKFKNVYYLYENASLDELQQYIHSLLNNVKRCIKGSKVEIINTSDIEVPYKIFEEFYAIYFGTREYGNDLYECIMFYKEDNVNIKQVKLMEKANEEKLKSIPFEIKDNQLLVKSSDLKFDSKEFNILIVTNNGVSNLVHASFLHAGNHVMKRQLYKLEFENRSGVAGDVPKLKINRSLRHDIEFVELKRATFIYSTVECNKNNTVRKATKGEIFEVTRIVSKVTGELAYKINEGYVTSDDTYVQPTKVVSSEQSSVYFSNVPEKMIAKVNINKEKRHLNPFLNNISVYEGEIITVKKLVKNTVEPILILDNDLEIIAKRENFTEFIQRSLEDYITNEVKKVKIIKACYLYDDRNFISNTKKRLKVGSYINVRRIVYNDNSIPRLLTTNGKYVTANKDFVLAVDG